MIAKDIRQKFLEFFKSKGHTVIPSASLVPENDPTVLFTTAGMHPLVPYLLGQRHPGGKRLVNYQKSARTDDIEEVGDDAHLTFFEMLGNWSLGDYWKKEAISWSYEFLTDKKWLGLDPKNLAVSVFSGDADAPRDNESAEIWKSLGVSGERIAYLSKKDNWWGPAGMTGPCGPDTEMFYWTGDGQAPDKFEPENTKWAEIWNDVFMQYNKTSEGKFEPLEQKNVDTGMGLERITAAMEGKPSIFETELFAPILEKIRDLSHPTPSLSPPTDLSSPDYRRTLPSLGEGNKEVSHYAGGERERSERIIADHLKAATFIISDGVLPSNKGRGYILRRLIRRAVRHGQSLEIEREFCTEIAAVVIDMYQEIYPDLKRHKEKIVGAIAEEDIKFRKTLAKGLREFENLVAKNTPSLIPSPQGGGNGGGEIPPPEVGEGRRGGVLTGKDAFDLFQTYGFPLELTEELARERGINLNKEEFEKEFAKHQELSRTSSAGVFKGGLADHSERTTRLHTATHLLQAGLRHILGNHLYQRGSHVTAERTRFDFNHPQKVTAEELEKVEEWVNKQVARDLPVKQEFMTPKQAHDLGAIGLFDEKYEDKVSVYTISDPATGEIVSREFCGGPHIAHTAEVGKFKIQKEEAVAAGIRRVKATVE